MKICLIAHFAYGVMTGGYLGHVGGVERQTTLMSRWLASRGHDVTLVTWDEGQPDEIKIDGVRIIKMCRQDAGVPIMRFFYPRWTSLIMALHRADSEVYYQNCSEYVTGQVAIWCRLKGVPFIYSVASDPDCDPDLPKLSKLRERILYRYGIKKASRIIVQTENQQSMLRKGFNLNSTVLPMPCPGPAEAEYSKPSHAAGNKFRVLWVGRISKVKRLEVLLEVAQKVPDVQFDIVGAQNENDSYSKDILSRAGQIPNVMLIGRVSRDEMPGVYKKASVLCCTSLYEGFPNTFIEAWSYGVPVVSTVDPDNLLSGRRLGLAATEPNEIAAGIKTLSNSPELWFDMSSNARQYYLANHTVNVVMRKFEDIFLDATGRS